MDKKVYEHVKAYNESHGYSIDEPTLIETIRECGKRLWKGDCESHRWWNEYTYVVELDGMIIGYFDAETTGDMSAWETGYEFDPNSIMEYEAKEIVTTTYVPKGNK